MRLGQLGAPLLTPVCMNTVNGRPVVMVAIPASCQPPNAAASAPPLLNHARSGPHAFSHPHLTPARCRTPTPAEPCPAWSWVTFCGFPTAPPPLAGEPP